MKDRKKKKTLWKGTDKRTKRLWQTICSLTPTNAIQFYKTAEIPLTLQYAMQLEFLGAKYLHMKHFYEKKNQQNIFGS